MRDRFLAYVVCGVLAFAFPISMLGQDGSQTTEPTGTASAAPPARGARETEMQETASTELPDSPGAVQEQAQSAQQGEQPSAQQQEPNSAQSPNQPSSQSQGATAQSVQAMQDSTPQRPVGTAAAAAPKVSGITAAEPAGVAIAPAKQHRVRTILIRVGAIVGAGVAVGTAIALTEATPSKPPGAR